MHGPFQVPAPLRWPVCGVREKRKKAPEGAFLQFRNGDYTLLRS